MVSLIRVSCGKGPYDDHKSCAETCWIKAGNPSPFRGLKVKTRLTKIIFKGIPMLGTFQVIKPSCVRRWGNHIKVPPVQREVHEIA